MIVITAESRATLTGWTGNIQVYSDNNVSSVEVVVKPTKQIKTVQVSIRKYIVVAVFIVQLFLGQC